MFDVSFTELMVIAVVALVVIGPERLPRVARTAGHLLGRLQRYVNSVKSDISREMHMDDLKRFEQQVRSQVGEIQNSVNSELLTVEQSVNDAVGIESPAIDSVASNRIEEVTAPISGLPLTDSAVAKGDAISPGLTSVSTEPVAGSSASTHG